MSSSLQRFSPRKYRGFFLKAKRLQGKNWTSFVSAGEDDTVGLAVIVRKNACKKSSQRNKIKRVTREMFKKSPQAQALKKIHIAFVWSSSRTPVSREIDEVIKNLTNLSL